MMDGTSAIAIAQKKQKNNEAKEQALSIPLKC
jgi:hypothetical protein